MAEGQEGKQPEPIKEIKEIKKLPPRDSTFDKFASHFDDELLQPRPLSPSYELPSRFPEREVSEHVKEIFDTKTPFTGIPKEPPPSLESIVEKLNQAAAKRDEEGETQWTRLFDISGNTPPEQAQLTYLCDPDHDNPKAKFALGEYLRATVQSGDTVLIEGYAAGEEVDEKQKAAFAYFPDNVTILGWDDMQAAKEGEQLGNELDRINAELRSTAIPEEEKRTLRVYRNGDLIPRVQHIVIKQRNKSMMQTIDTLQKEGSSGRIFVYTGADHIRKDDELVEYSKQYLYVVLTAKL